MLFEFDFITNSARLVHGLKPVTQGLRGRDRESCAPSFSSGRFPLSKGLESVPDEREQQPILNSEFWILNSLLLASRQDPTAWLIAALNPGLTILVKFLLPDGNRLLDGVDGESTGVECRGAVGGNNHDCHAAFPRQQPSEPMHD